MATVRFLHGLDAYVVDQVVAGVSAEQAKSWAAQGIVSIEQDQPPAADKKPAKRTATAAAPSRRAVNP